MTDPMALVTAGAPEATELAGIPPSAAGAARLDPGDVRMFADLMHGQGAPTTPAAAAGSGSLGNVAKSLAEQLTGGRSFQEMRHSMLESIDLRDPIKTMFVMTDHSMEAHAMFTRMHIATGLASAATSLFGTLLKNQQ